ncbi:AMP-binding protein [Spirochaeta cellobiosiphila]|uniref:AMP-binding protein n=1 Tax=Spirochaeta cellobiosiphila TaxID=504483 RepID=UPI000A00C4F6|nr:AMP-binding protein [Spirochaeta cellobiosiphila]
MSRPDIKKFTLQNVWRVITKLYTTLPVLSYVDETPLSYNDLKDKVEALSAFFQQKGIKPGDKVALLAENGPEWGVCYFAINNIGAIIVPIMTEFSKIDVTNILTHSESSAIAVSSRLKSKVDTGALAKDFQVFSTESFFDLPVPESLDVPEIEEDDTACIIYTSGTTGKSKGVMLSNKNIAWNAWMGLDVPKYNEKQIMVSLLPMAHTYECSLGFLLPILGGGQVFYLKRPPSASILLPALKKVRPHMLLSVPLLIEKIYRQNILPKFKKSKLLSKLHSIPFFRKILNRIAGKQMKKLFGGRMHFFGIGGAGLDPEVELFLREAKFPYCIGYGLTETSPLIAGSNPQNVQYKGVGPLVPGVEVVIDDPNEEGVGEIVVRGPSIMQGYYKEPEMTREVLSEDGWFRTGDLGLIDKKKHLFIKGRLKNVILGPSGENIYPEAIEALINNMDFVEESLVYEEEDKSIVARIHLDYDSISKYFEGLASSASHLAESASHIPKDIGGYLHHVQEEINKQVAKFSRINKVIEQKEPFEKTPKKSIRRFLYTQYKKITGSGDGGSKKDNNK